MFFKKHGSTRTHVILLVILIAALIGIYPAQAETLDTGWAESLGGPLLDYGGDLAIDGQENVYVAGFTTVGTGNTDIIIQKMDAGGNANWSRTIGGASGDNGHAIAVDDGGNVYVTGNFSQTVDFDPGLGVTNLTSAGSGDIFILKLDGNGQLIWAKQVGGAGADSGNGLSAKGGYLYVVGSFSDTVDFDPGVGVNNMTSQGDTDIFISKLDTDGNLVWVKTMGGSAGDTSFDTAVDDSGNIFITGYFSETVDFDPGPGISQRTSAGETDLFINKFDSNGNFLWVTQGAGAQGDAAIEVRLDAGSNAYVTGYFNGSFYFDSGPGAYGAGANDIFVSKLDANGNPIWVKAMTGTSFDSGYGIALDSNANVYTTGEFHDTADFDAGPSGSYLTSTGSSDIFLSKLDTNGEFVWAKKMGSSAYDAGDGIAVGSNDHVYLTGAYSETVDFDPGVGVSNLTSTGEFDIFVSKLVITPQIHYVRQGAIGSNTGSSWADAYTSLQSAMAAATSGNEIWVAAGTYKPTTGTDRTISFVLKNGVGIYGGFAGTETLRSQRNYATHVTTLSGDIGIPDDMSDNSYHVVIGGNTNHYVVLDGFTVSGGNANGNSQYQENGGGMLNFPGSPTVSNVIFTNNYGRFGGGMYNGAFPPFPNSPGSNPILTNVIFDDNSATEGGGMENLYSSPSLTNVVFSNNTAIRAGGGMSNNSNNNPTLINVTFSGNTAPWGGGMANWIDNNPTLDNVTFSGNSAEWGGGMGNYQSNPVLTNVTFNGNSATTFGGAISNEHNSNPTLRNVTISGNSAVTYGGGIYNDYSGGSIRSSILYGNTAGEIYNASGSAAVSYSIVQGGYPGTGNLNVNPLLVSLQSNGGFTKTMAIFSGSPAIDAGDDANCPETDQRGVTRPQGSHCDIGAYEAEYYTVSGNAGAPGVILSYADTIYGTACVALPDGSQSCTTPLPVPASKYHYVTSDQNGNYSFQMPEGWVGTVVPSKPGYTFSPVKRTYFDLSGNQLNQNYTASLVNTILPPDPGSTRRVVPADAVPSDNPLDFKSPNISGNGRYVAYVSNSPDLVLADLNQRDDVFVWDRLTDTTRRVSVNSGGEEANDHSFFPSLSKDGRYIAFESWSTNLDTTCTSGRNVFVHDTQTGQTICASVNAGGVMGNNISERPAISANGRYVVYNSWATNLVSGDTNYHWDVFVFDIFSRTTVRVSVSSTGAQGNGYSEDAAISGNGRYVAFWSNASNLVTGDTNANYDVFVRDILTNTTSRVSINSSGVEGNGTSRDPSISEDGRYIAFTSDATNLVDGDTNTTYDVFLHDLQTQTTTRVSVSSGNAQGNDLSVFPKISGNGRFVMFESKASNLVGNDPNLWNVIFVRDLLLNKTSRVSVSSDGTQANDISTHSSLSSDGRYVVFESAATNLASPVVSNRYRDAYLHENTFLISGNAGIAGATLTYRDGSLKTVTSDGSGNYTLPVSYGWTGTVTPSRNGYTFTPASRSYADVSMDQTGNNYVAMAIVTNTATHTATPTVTNTATSTPSFTPTVTATHTATLTATHTATPTVTRTPTVTAVPTRTKRPNHTPQPTKPPRRSLAILPTSMITQSGSTSGSPSSLNWIEQNGTEDDPSAYVQFQASGHPYMGYHSFSLPVDAQSPMISSMLLQVNFKRTSATQTWTWSLYDWTTGNWVVVGNSLGSPPTEWDRLLFSIHSMTRYVSPSGEVRVRLQSTDASEDAKIDYMAIHMTYDPVAPTPTSVIPTAVPTRPRYNFPATYTPTP